MRYPVNTANHPEWFSPGVSVFSGGTPQQATLKRCDMPTRYLA